MHKNTLSAWGLLVGKVCRAPGVICQYVSPVCSFGAMTARLAGDNPSFIQVSSHRSTSSTPQLHTSLYSLLIHYFYPFSTPPITTNVMKGLKK